MASTVRGSDNFDSAGVGKNTSAGAVGSYVFAGFSGSPFAVRSVDIGGTASGSALSPAGVSAYYSWGGTAGGVDLEDGTHTGVYQKQNGSLSGTWRCMGFATSYNASNYAPHTLWLRIS